MRKATNKAFNLFIPIPPSIKRSYERDFHYDQMDSIPDAHKNAQMVRYALIERIYLFVVKFFIYTYLVK
jgi:hypothetical protein